VSVVCCQIDVCATGRSLVQSSRTQCGVSECDLETSTMRGLTRAVEPLGGGCLNAVTFFIYEAVLGLLKNIEKGM
jgi:hypothetical protein